MQLLTYYCSMLFKTKFCVFHLDCFSCRDDAAQHFRHNKSIIQHTFPFPILSFPPSVSGHKHSVEVEVTQQQFKFSPDGMKT